MTTQFTPSTADASTGSEARAGGAADRELVAAARMLLQRMNVDPADLMTDPADRPPVPTFDAYIPAGRGRRHTQHGQDLWSYWNRIRAKWGSRTLLEPTPTEIKQFGGDQGQRRPAPQLARWARRRREIHRRAALHLPARRRRRADQARREPSPPDRQTPTASFSPARAVRQPDA